MSENTRLHSQCATCAGRGWVKVAERPWPEACPKCAGRGRFTTRSLAKLLNVDHRTLERVAAVRSRAGTARQVFERLCSRGFV